MEEPVILKIVPNQQIILTDDIPSTVLGSGRVLITDQNDFGIILPAFLDPETHKASFILPEQLCIFNPEQTYVLTLELEATTDSSGFSVCTSYPVQIAPGGLLEPVEPEKVPEAVPDLEAPNKPPGPLSDDVGLDALLDAVAPASSKRNAVKKLQLADIAEDVIQRSMWQPPPSPLPESSSERDVLKGRMKKLLRGMLG